ncbi:protein RESISTANCE TO PHYTOPHTHORA 1, chloroplastic [Cornus florida]|uniref:protein RESISTANCE TO PHYTOPHTHORA 1, chloroplastic n=1 Tax=Cornus florida TaxID=4283 RepID=UPI002897818E|nr:protein RESISTANCE TO PHYTOPHTHORA 1, chloroplastic [Cornus florida]
MLLKNMNTLISTSLCNRHILKVPITSSFLRNSSFNTQFRSKSIKIHAGSNELDTQTVEEFKQELEQPNGMSNIEQEAEGLNQASTTVTPTGPAIDKDLKKVVQKTAATFAPRASTATKNPAVPGTALYSVFEVQGYASMLLGGALAFNLIFPSNEPDIWRLMGMWSIWMFTIPSLRARDCSKNEKEALNYLFLLVPLLNVTIPFFWKSFAVVWSADTVAFFAMYAWKLGWLQKKD